MTSAPVAAAREVTENPYRIMLVDDSAVIRGFFRRTLESDPCNKIVASVGNGEKAVDAMAKNEFDIIVLDIEMPVMDGLTALPELLKADPTVKIIMASTLTVKNADISLKAITAGAADYIPKPLSASELHSAQNFKHELIEKVMALGASRRRRKGEPVPNAASQVAKKGKSSNGPIALRAPSKATPAVLAVGSSTGGPQALLQFFRELNDDIDLPIFVTQHMPATFTGILAQHISNIAGCEAKEGEDGEIIKHGIIYIAPGDYHMVLERGSTGNIIRLNQEPPQNFCRPSVDPMLSSMVDLYGNKLLCIILTGMGQDGLKGAEVVVNAGGTVVAQDEDTSIVWGMPGAVAEAGLCSAVLPMGKIAGHVSEIVGRK